MNRIIINGIKVTFPQEFLNEYKSAMGRDFSQNDAELYYGIAEQRQENIVAGPEEIKIAIMTEAILHYEDGEQMSQQDINNTLKTH